MSGGSLGTIAGGAVGGLLGFFVGAPGIGFSIGATLGGAIGGALDPPKGPKVEGQRLNDLTVQTSTYGATIPRLYGTLTLFGNIFWIENNQVTEVAKKVKQGGKGIGGSKASTKTYSYYGTFALGLCEGPIIGIKKIWIGPKLFYNADGNNPDINELVQSVKNSQYFRVYKGDDTQLADTRMQATLGAANTSAYRGHAYIMFYDLPLAEYGNSIALTQIKVEVIKAGTEDYILNNPSNVGTSNYPVGIEIYKNKFAIVSNLNESNIAIYNVVDPNSPFLIKLESAGGIQTCITISGNTAYLPRSTGSTISVIDLGNGAEAAVMDATRTITIQNLGALPGFFRIIRSIRSDDNYLYCLTHGGYLQIYNLAGDFLGYCDTSFAQDANSYGSMIMDIDADSNYLYVVGYGSDTFEIVDISIKAAPVVLSTLSLVGTPAGVAIDGDYAYITFNDSVIASDGQSGLTVVNISDPLAPSVVLAMDVALKTTRDIKISNGYAYVGSNSGLSVFNLEDPELPVLVGTIANTYFNQIHNFVVNDNYIYTTNHASGNLSIFFFIQPTITNDTVPLSEIVSAESIQAELITTADIDVTSLTPLVRGYRISQIGAIRGSLDQLQASWPFDAIQSGYQIKFVLRGGASVETIDEDYLDARDFGAEPGVQISNSREMDSTLPAKVSIKFFDVDREYNTGDQYAERINTDAVNIREIELSIVLTATEAAQKADILLYMYWLERYEISFSLSPEYSQLEPADIITITTSDATYIVRLTTINYLADGRLECKARYHLAAVYVSQAVGEGGRSTGVEMIIQGPTLYKLLDIPMLQDVYDQPGYSVAMTGYQSGWPGGVLFVSDDDGQLWTELQSFTTPGSTIGYAEDTLSTHAGTVIDYSSRLTIRMYQGTLSSVTETQMFDGQNWFAYGVDGRWEIIAAMNVTLESGGDYLLFDFLRGQMGTEWATGLHDIGDTIVLLNSDELEFLATSSGYIGVDRDYRGITVGDDINSDSSLTFSYDGVNLEPLSPCQLTGSRHPTTNDWTIVWTRRSRYAGWRNLADIPLGETTESYEVDVYDATYTTLKRTLTSTTQTVGYTSAQQVTDFGSNQSTIYLKIYQLSSVVGRGYALTQSLTR